MAETLMIVFPIYQGVTQLDFTGPHQFLSRLPGAEVIVASMGGNTVTADGWRKTCSAAKTWWRISRPSINNKLEQIPHA
ncbi:TPA: hypothetical protein ACKP1B_004922 [Serratia fonticola]